MYESLKWWFDRVFYVHAVKINVKHNSFSRVLLSAFPFQNNIFKGLVREYHHNVQLIIGYIGGGGLIWV